MRGSLSIGTVVVDLRVTGLTFTGTLAVLVLRTALLALGGAASTCTVDLDLRPVDRCEELSLAVLLASLNGLVMAGELSFMIAGVDLKKVSQLWLIAMLCSTTDGGLTRGVSVT